MLIAGIAGIAAATAAKWITIGKVMVAVGTGMVATDELIERKKGKK